MAIFSAQFLQQYLNDFDQQKVVDFQRKKEILHTWIQSLDSGKADNEKEIAIKSTFVNDFFGQVLGYAYSNANNWLLQQEQKSVTDGTRSDAAFGYFSLQDQGIKADIRMVAEFKDSTKPLDIIHKNRAVKISAIDQAFLYASKMPGKCSWVVVCNAREIRFYHYSTQTEFQGYLLTELLDDRKLLELIFLFHAEHVLSREHSARTDKLYALSKKKVASPVTRTSHIVEDLYLLIKKFEGLTFVDPVYLAGLYPFNVLGQKVWHYNQGVLHTTNPKLFKLLSRLEIKEKGIVLSNELERELEREKVAEPLKKLHYIFERLNRSLVFHLTAVEDLEVVKKEHRNVLGFSLSYNTGYSRNYGVIRHINVMDDNPCTCVSCLFSDLNWKALLLKLKSYHPEQQDMEYAYGKYLLHAHGNNQVYYALEKLEKQFKSSDHHIARYLVTKMNLKNIQHDIDSSGAHGRAIKAKLQALDLDAVIAYEVDLFAAPELRGYLVEMKGSVLINRLSSMAAESKLQTKNILEVTLRRDQIEASDQVDSLQYQRAMLSLYSQANFLMTDQLGKVRSIYTDIFQACLNSFLTPGSGLKEFDENILTDAILNIHPSTINELLKEVPELRVSGQTREAMLIKAGNLLRSFVGNSFGRFGPDRDMEEQMHDLSSKFALYPIFNCTFIIIGKIGCSRQDIEKIAPLITNYLQSDQNYFDQDMPSLSLLIENYGEAFTTGQLLKILEHIIPKLKVHSHQHDHIFNAVCKSWRKNFPIEKIHNGKLIKLAAVTHMGGSNPDYMRLVNLWHITDSSLKSIISEELERHLDLSFNGMLYQDLLHEQVFEFDYKDYFFRYVREKQSHNTPDGFFHIREKSFFNPSIYNLAVVVHRFNVPADHPALLALTGLTDFQSWLLYPEKFDYTNFNVLWLKDIQGKYLFGKLRGNSQILQTLDEVLHSSFDPVLAEVYFRYISNPNRLDLTP